MPTVAGFSLGRIVPGGKAHVPLHDGLSALYGLNGSGKSRILAAIRDSLARDERTSLAGDGFDYVYLAERVPDVLHERHRSRERSAELMRDRLGDEKWGRLMEKPDPTEMPSKLRQHLEATVEEQLAAADALSIDYPDALQNDLIDALMQRGVLMRWRVVHHAVETRTGWSVGLHPTDFPDGFPAVLAHIGSLWEGISDELDDPDADPEVHEFEYALRETFAELPSAASEWPRWVAQPIARVGKGMQRLADYLDDQLPRVVVADASSDVDRELLDALRSAFPQRVNVPDWDIDPREVRADDKGALEQFSTRLGARATAALERYLGPPAPSLRVEIAPLHEWHHGDLIKWTALDPLSASVVPFRELSSAQHRWARVAIAEALASEGRADPFSRRASSSVLLIDEPELALHPQAIRHVCLALSAGEHRSTIVATHSPIVLGSADRTLEVRRSDVPPVLEVRDGGHLLQPVLNKPQSEEHGLLRSDFLSMTRLLVLVEGQHDRIVYVELLRKALADARAVVAEVGGSLAMAEALRDAALFRALDCPILILLDDFSDDDRRWWGDLVEAARIGSKNPEEVVREVRSRASHRNDRWDVFRQIADRTLEVGVVGRVHVEGIPVLDIPQLFPPVAFGLPADQTWADVEASMVSDYGKRTSANFKKWMESHSARIDARSVLLACRAVSTDQVTLGEREEAWLEKVAEEIRRLGETPRAQLDSLSL